MASKHNPANERIKRRYQVFLAEAKGLSEATVDQCAAAIDRFEASTGFKDFRAFHIEQARAFKRRLLEDVLPETGKPMAKATAHGMLRALKAFFEWLSRGPGFKSKIGFSDASYFNLTDNDTRIAKTTRERPVPSLEQLHHTLSSMPAMTDLQKRDRALFALIMLTGARDRAVVGLKIKHLDLARRRLIQDPRDEVKTKRRKTIVTTFFPIGGEAEAIIVEWANHLTMSMPE